MVNGTLKPFIIFRVIGGGVVFKVDIVIKEKCHLYLSKLSMDTTKSLQDTQTVIARNGSDEAIS